MFLHQLGSIPNRKVILQWFLMTFSAGCINAGGFMATGRFVSHVTGFATLFGVDLVNGQMAAAIGILSVPFFFLLGAFLAGWLIDRRVFLNKKPHVDWVMALCGLCLVLSAIDGVMRRYGTSSGNMLDVQHAYNLLVLLCLACGLQNAALTSSTGSSVRTTHLTGLTTDLGLGLARVLSLPRGSQEMKSESTSNVLRSGSIASFILGSGIGAFSFLKWGDLGFLLPAGISFYAAWHGRHFKARAHRINPATP